MLRRRASVAALVLGVVTWGFGSSSPVVADVLERLQSGESLRVGFRNDARPFSYRDGDEFTGYSVELCDIIINQIAGDLGLAELDVEFTDVTTEERFDAVAEGRIDMLCGAATATLERRQLVNFSIPIFLTGVSAVYRTDAPAFLREVLAGNRPSLPPRAMITQALANRTFAARSGTTAETFVNESVADLAVNAKVETVDDHRIGLERVASGQYDAYFADRDILLGVIAEHDDPNLFAVAERYFSFEPIALALPRNDDDFRLAVDTILSRLYRSGEALPIVAKYFGTPGPELDAILQLSALPE